MEGMREIAQMESCAPGKARGELKRRLSWHLFNPEHPCYI